MGRNPRFHGGLRHGTPRASMGRRKVQPGLHVVDLGAGLRAALSCRRPATP
ncbi:MAG: hypothetical protein QOH11_2762, partial [Solirubrobacteraceae bacterium]|nr:hypothetical protein [Solirubrobacteraceae bacterium]